jgi:hypothetical protein
MSIRYIMKYDTIPWVGVKRGNGTKRTGGTGMAERKKG